MNEWWHVTSKMSMIVVLSVYDDLHRKLISKLLKVEYLKGGGLQLGRFIYLYRLKCREEDRKCYGVRARRLSNASIVEATPVTLWERILPENQDPSKLRHSWANGTCGNIL